MKIQNQNYGRTGAAAESHQTGASQCNCHSAGMGDQSMDAVTAAQGAQMLSVFQKLLNVMEQTNANAGTRGTAPGMDQQGVPAEPEVFSAKNTVVQNIALLYRRTHRQASAVQMPGVPEYQSTGEDFSLSSLPYYAFASGDFLPRMGGYTKTASRTPGLFALNAAEVIKVGQLYQQYSTIAAATGADILGASLTFMCANLYRLILFLDFKLQKAKSSGKTISADEQRKIIWNAIGADMASKCEELHRARNIGRNYGWTHGADPLMAEAVELLAADIPVAEQTRQLQVVMEQHPMYAGLSTQKYWQEQFMFSSLNRMMQLAFTHTISDLSDLKKLHHCLGILIQKYRFVCQRDPNSSGNMAAFCTMAEPLVFPADAGGLDQEAQFNPRTGGHVLRDFLRPRNTAVAGFNMAEYDSMMGGEDDDEDNPLTGGDPDMAIIDQELERISGSIGGGGASKMFDAE